VANTALLAHVVDAIDQVVATFTATWPAYTLWLDKQYYLTAADRAMTRNLTFAALVEEMVRNVTLSLFSEKSFW
jgi:hypothetical protein